MIITKTTLTILLVLLLNLAFGQGNDRKPISADLVAKQRKANAATKQGDEALAAGRTDDAIAAFREVVKIEGTYGHFVSSGNYDLAKALTLAGRTDEALAAYRRAFKWDPARKDLKVNGPPVVDLAMDYAILLAKSGKADEAKSIYYYGLRSGFNPYGESTQEPFPFLVVFDPEDVPNATVWDYSADSLIAAATMAKAPTAAQTRPLVQEVRRMEPGWVLPVVYLARMLTEGSKKEALLSEAEGLARTDAERGWIKAYRAGENLAKIGLSMRKASSAIANSKLDLQRTHDKVGID